MRISRQAKIYVLTEMLYGVAMGLYGFVLNLYLERMGIMAAQIGVLTGAAALVRGVAAFPLSAAVSKIGRKNTYGTGVLIAGIGIFLYALPLTFPLALCAALTVALGFVMVEVTEVQVMYDACESDSERVKIYSVAYAAFALSCAGGTFAGGMILRFLEAVRGYKVILLLSFAMTAVTGVLRLVFLKNRKENAPEICRQSKCKKNWRKLAGCLSLTLLLMLSNGVYSPFASLMMRRLVLMGDETISVFLTLGQVACFCFALAAPWLQTMNRRKGLSYYVIFGLLIGCNGLLGCGLFMGAFSYFYILLCALGVMLRNMIDSALFLMLENESRDRYAGLRSLLSGVAGAGMAMLSGNMMQQQQYEGMFFLCAGLMAAAFVVWRCFAYPTHGKSALG